eukprot:427791_1
MNQRPYDPYEVNYSDSSEWGWMIHYYMGVFLMFLLIYCEGQYDNFKEFRLRRDIYWGLQTLSFLLISCYLFTPYSDYYDWPKKQWNWQTSSIYYYAFGGGGGGRRGPGGRRGRG